MRQIEEQGAFKRDYKRELKGRHRESLESSLVVAIAALANDLPLPSHYRDHALIGNWRDHRDCHIKPDLVLIYRKVGTGSLHLVRLGSHAELCL
ncbi:MAG: type II toxin-antitoxin system YafQ family toxin [Nitrosospira sp.]|nr:type II toxin-antitoxin system YafQ family toxin [Nitrosospira sp.]